MKKARELGIKTVAIFLEDDSASPHLSLAGEKYALAGHGTAAYLNINQKVYTGWLDDHLEDLLYVDAVDSTAPKANRQAGAAIDKVDPLASLDFFREGSPTHKQEAGQQTPSGVDLRLDLLASLQMAS